MKYKNRNKASATDGGMLRFRIRDSPLLPAPPPDSNARDTLRAKQDFPLQERIFFFFFFYIFAGMGREEGREDV